MIRGRASLRAQPSDGAAQDSELLLGESFTVYERTNGWAWGQAKLIPMSAMCANPLWALPPLSMRAWFCR